MVGILGPRQCGKTTLARDYLAARPEPQIHYFDLEDPDHLNRLADPKLALEGLEGLIVIDEIQRSPELFPLLRVLIDRRPRRQRYLILGSASRALIRQSSETLAGRIAYLELPPFTAFEAPDPARLWLRGGFPPSYLAPSDVARALAARRGVSLGSAVSDLARRGFRQTGAGGQDDDGVPVFRVAAGAAPITSEDVQKALSEWP